jgi:hypothetical protein
MSARTAARRRRQAVGGYRHLAKIGRGNNNRPIYHKKSESKLTQHEQRLRERQKAMQMRMAFRKKR